MAPFNLLAVFAIGFINFATASTAISSEIVPAVPSDAITSVVFVTTTVYTPNPPIVTSPVPSVDSGIMTIQTSTPESSATTSIMSSVLTSIASIVTGPVPSVDSGIMTIQTSTHVRNGSTPVVGTSYLSTPSVGTIMITYTANKSTTAPTATQPNHSASSTSDFVNVAAAVNIGVLGLVGAVVAGVIGA